MFLIPYVLILHAMPSVVVCICRIWNSYISCPKKEESDTVDEGRSQTQTLEPL